MISHENTITRRERIAAFLLLAVFFTFGLFDHSLWSANDSREGAMIAEMFRTGTWVAPFFNGSVYLEKPPLMHWTSLLFCHSFGLVNEGLVRLPAALFGLGSVIIAYLFGREIGRERAGLTAAFMCAISAQYFEYSKVVLTDTTLTFMIMFSLYLFWKSYSAVGKKWILYTAFILISGLSFYAKGLLGPGIIWLSVCAFLVYQRKWKLLCILLLIFIPAVILILMPWIIALWKTGGREFLITAFWANQFGRFFSFYDQTLPLDPYYVHKEPITYYLFHLPARLMPWTLLVPPALVYWFRRGKGLGSLPAIFIRFVFCSIVLILHISTAKAVSYALPMFPILFLMIGIWLEDAVVKRLKIDRWLINITFGTIALMLLIIPLGYIGAYCLRWNVLWAPGAGVAAVCLGLALLTMLFGLYSAYRLWRQFRSGARDRIILPGLIVIVSLFVMNMSFITPAYDCQRTYLPFIDLVRREINDGRRIGLASEEERVCGQFMFYLNRTMDIIPITNDLAGFLYNSDEPTAVILPIKYRDMAVQLLTDHSFKTVQCDHTGYKSQEFILIENFKNSAERNTLHFADPSDQD